MSSNTRGPNSSGLGLYIKDPAKRAGLGNLRTLNIEEASKWTLGEVGSARQSHKSQISQIIQISQRNTWPQWQGDHTTVSWLNKEDSEVRAFGFQRNDSTYKDVAETSCNRLNWSSTPGTSASDRSPWPGKPRVHLPPSSPSAPRNPCGSVFLIPPTVCNYDSSLLFPTAFRLGDRTFSSILNELYRIKRSRGWKPTQVTKKEKKNHSRLLWQNEFLLCKGSPALSGKRGRKGRPGILLVHEMKAVWIGPSRLFSNYLPLLGKLHSVEWMGYYYHPSINLFFSRFSLNCFEGRKRHKN